MSAKSTFAALAAVLALAPVAFGQGRIPIDRPTTIDKSGSYVVTRDIVGSGAFALELVARDIDIDLGGFVIRGDVRLQPVGIAEQRIALRNGRVEGRMWRNITAGPTRTVDGAASLRMSKVTGFGGGIALFPCWQFIVRDSILEGPVSVIGDTGFVAAVVVNNTFGSSADWAGFEGGVVRGNTFGADLTLRSVSFDSNKNILDRNTIRGRLVLESNGAAGGDLNLVVENTAGAIEVRGTANHLRGNTVRGGSIVVSGSRNTIEGNTVKGNGYGLVLNGDDNVYLDNVLRRNGLGAVQDNGLGNFDGGGNVR